MIPKTPRAVFRLALWIVLLSLGGCGGSQPPPQVDPVQAAEAFCGTAAVPLPAGAPREAQELHEAAMKLCAVHRLLEKDGGG